MTFIPFDASESEIAERHVLRDGVPKTMRNGLRTWIVKCITFEREWIRVETLHELENNLDIDFGLNPILTTIIKADQVHLLLETKVDARMLLRIADYLLATRRYGTSPEALEAVLQSGRSKWTVTQEEGSVRRLRARVSEGVQKSAEELMSHDGLASKLLLRAWNSVYDLNPETSAAYASAVKAVETAAFPVLGIEDKPTATLTTVIQALAKNGSNWRLPFQREHTDAPSRDVLLGMLKSLYRGQRDRHGSAAYEDVTQEEAEAAVIMAVTLVGWFSQGLVAERDPGAFA